MIVVATTICAGISGFISEKSLERRIQMCKPGRISRSFPNIVVKEVSKIFVEVWITHHLSRSSLHSEWGDHNGHYMVG